ncbi:MAG TPA: MFS transporter [Moheibacter sp.]|nr:MFS transporter [Moheibacter sp.]
MTENKKSFGQTVTSLNKTFWVASIMELFERWAWYGMFALFGLYLVGSTDDGALGLNHIEKGKIMGDITAILYLLPVFFGVIADRIGYKLSLGIAYVIMIIGYFMMGQVDTFWMMYMAFFLAAVGAAFFKPVASAIVARNTDETTGTLGFGIFYMMVNIGGFIGPLSSSVLRTELGWKIIFVQAAVVIGLNLLILIFFFKEKKVVAEQPKASLGAELKNSVMNIFEALKDVRLGILLLLMVCFWTMFNQLFYTLPNFIEDWVDSRIFSDWLNANIPMIGKHFTDNGLIKPELFTQIDSFMIICCQIFISYFVTKMRHINAVIRGAIIATIGVSLTFFTNNPMFTVLGIMIFAIGEMMSSPTVSSFIALITPKGKEGLYQGTYFLPVALGNYFSGFIAGDLYQAWSDKLSLLKTEMGKRDIEMPEIVSSNQFIEEGSKSLGMSLTDFENQFHLKAEQVDWNVAYEAFQKFAIENGLDISAVHAPFSKNEYFALAEQKLGMGHWEMANMLWESYNPNKIWYVVAGIGIFSVITLSLYDRMIIRPRERKMTQG